MLFSVYLEHVFLLEPKYLVSQKGTKKRGKISQCALLINGKRPITPPESGTKIIGLTGSFNRLKYACLCTKFYEHSKKESFRLHSLAPSLGQMSHSEKEKKVSFSKGVPALKNSCNVLLE